MAPRPRVCPDKPLLGGIDVSRYQGTIDWPRVVAEQTFGPPPGNATLAGSRLAFAIARASTGRAVDSKFATNWRAMKRAGVGRRGCYLGFHPLRSPAVHFNALKDALDAGGGLEETDLPPVIDIEKLEDVKPPVGTGPEDVDELVKRARELVAMIEETLRRRPMIYTGAFWHFQVAAVRPRLAGAFASLPLWTPHYEATCPGVPAGWKRWEIWQYTSSGRVPGIAGRCDEDWFRGGYDDLACLVANSIVRG